MNTPTIKRGDEVEVIAGKDAGLRGRVLWVLPKKNRVVVEGAARVTRHEKISLNRRGAQEGGISHKESPISISNVALVCPKDGPTRVGHRFDEEQNKKIRVCKKCGEEI